MKKTLALGGEGLWRRARGSPLRKTQGTNGPNRREMAWGHFAVGIGAASIAAGAADDNASPSAATKPFSVGL